MDQQNKEQNIGGQRATPFAQTYFHGTKADLKIGSLIEVGYNSNYGQQKNARYIFLTATLDAAIWGAELAFGQGRERIYLVEPTGKIENDPDLRACLKFYPPENQCLMNLASQKSSYLSR
jgi:rifampin ADP-ribosylating transferase